MSFDEKWRYLPDFDNIDFDTQVDVMVSEVPVVEDVITDPDKPADIYHGKFTPSKPFGDIDDLSFDNDLTDDECNTLEVLDFISGQDELLVVGQTLEVVRNEKVRIGIRSKITGGGYKQLNFVLANIDLSTLSAVPPQLYDSFSALMILDEYARFFGQEINVWATPTPFPLDFIMVGGRNEDSMPVSIRLQNERARFSFENADVLNGRPVRCLLDYVPNDVIVMGKIDAELRNLFETCRRVEFR